MQYMESRESLFDLSSYKINLDEGNVFSKYWNKQIEGEIDDDGYRRIRVKCKDNKQRTYFLHRIIYYCAHGDIPEGMQVNHINENKLDNRIQNLNLMTCKENINWGNGIKRRTIQRSQRVIAYNEDGEIVYEFESMMEAERQYGYDHRMISKSCKTGELYKGLHWEKI